MTETPKILCRICEAEHTTEEHHKIRMRLYLREYNKNKRGYSRGYYKGGEIGKKSISSLNKCQEV